MEPGSPPEVILFIVDAGGGHRASANALVAAAEQEGRPWRFRIVNLQQVLASLDFWRRVTGRPMEETYNELIRAQRTRFLVPTLRVLQFLIRLLRGPLSRRLARELRERPAALVISLMPNFNAVLRDAVRQALPGTSFFVLLTDYADFPRHFWIEHGIDRVIVGSDRAAEQARQAGLPGDRITRTSGMVLSPSFYQGGGPDARAVVRQELGIPEDAFVVMELFGGKGSEEMRALSVGLVRQSPDWHVIAICGDNPPLLEALTEIAAESGGRLHPLGFTKRIADYLAASDVLATKPGPGSLAEAFQQGVPVVVTSNAWTIPQERFNAEMVHKQGLGRVVASVQEMPAAVAALKQDPAAWEQVRAKVRSLPPNRAAFEALDVIETELRRAGALPTAAHPMVRLRRSEPSDVSPRLSMTASRPRSEPKLLYRRLDRLLGLLNAALPQRRTLQSFLKESFTALQDDLRLAAAALYQEGRDRFALTHAAGATREWAEELAFDAPAVALPVEHGVYLFDRESRAGLIVGQRPSRHLFLFELAEGWQRDELDFALNTVRSAVGARLADERVRGSFREAAAIQQSLLVEEPPPFPGYDLAARSVPTEEVGGDFYDFLVLDPDTLGIAIGDASGHGLPAALLVRDVVTGLRMGLEKHLKIAHVFAKLNRVIHRSNLSSRFVSVFFGELETGGNLIYVNAGHPPPRIFSPQGVRELSVGGTVIGPLPDSRFRRGIARLDPGDVLVLCSDGILERRGHGTDFGDEGVRAILDRYRSEPARRILDLLFEQAWSHGDARPWDDDVTAVVVRRL